MSKSQKNLYHRVLDLMNELKYIQKEDKKVNNQYTFVSHDAVSAAIHPMLVKYGIAMFPSVEDMTVERITYQKWDSRNKVYKDAVGNLVMAKVKVTFVNADDPKDAIEVYFYGQGMDDSDKAVGKAISYACKYAMLKVFCLETGDDPDTDANSNLGIPETKEIFSDPIKTPTLSKEQVSYIMNQIKDEQDTVWLTRVLENSKIAHLSQMPQKWYPDLCNSFDRHLKTKGVS